MTIAIDAESRSLAGRRWAGHAITRLATVGDQLLVALANFGLTVSIGRAFGAEDVAAYGIGLSVGLMVQALQRHAVLIPLMLLPPARVARRRGAIFAEHALVLASVFLLTLAGMALAPLLGISGYGRLILAASAVCLLNYVQLEFARAILVKLERPWSLIASASWYTGVSAALALASLHHLISFEGLLIALATAMVIHAAALFTLARGFALWRGLMLFTADFRQYGGWAVVATITYSGYSHLPLFILGALAPPIHAAVFVATRGLLQPLQILLRGFDLADKAGFAERSGAPHSPGAFRLTLKLAAFYAATAGLFGLAAGFFADELVRLAYGQKFAGFEAALIAWVPVYVLLSVSLPFESLVYARQVFRDYYIVRGIGSIAGIALTVPLMPWVEVGAIAACGIGCLIAILGTIYILLRGQPR
jgi:O-antigen/teichoic acid export membrane protein